MNWDKKSISATLACFLFVAGYMWYLQQKYPDFYANQKGGTEEVTKSPDPQPAKPRSEELASSEAPSALAPADVGALDETPLPADQLTFDTETRVIRFDQKSGAIASIHLKDYAENIEEKTPSELLDSPMVIQGSTQILNRTGKTGFAAKREGDHLTLTRRDGIWEISQVFTVPKSGYGLDVLVTFKNTSGEPQELTGGTLIQENLKKPEGGSFLTPASVNDVHLVYGLGGKRSDVTLKDYCEKGEGSAVSLTNEVVDYIGLDKHYFLTSLWAKGQKMNYVIERSAPASEHICPMATLISQQFGLVQAGGSVEMKLEGFFGPKKLEVLDAYDPALKSSIKYGFLSMVAQPLLASMKWVHNLVKNWGVAIIIITLILKILFYPLTRSSAISMKRMQKLQPEMNALREKFKEDPQRQQRELMAFMSKNKVNPFKGCLPILPQIPVFMAFYSMLSSSIELRHAPFFGWIQDLSARDPYLITPIILGAGMFLQQKLTPNPAMDKNQEKIMLMMPLVFSLMMLSLPAGMVIYMITNTIVSIIQQQWLNRRIARELG
jgi:YidC/Oxa1 family membrane protein insertase